jgi:hypothetical protein
MNVAAFSPASRYSLGCSAKFACQLPKSHALGNTHKILEDAEETNRLQAKSLHFVVKSKCPFEDHEADWISS